ncbi:MAG: hypothetical protein ACI9MC_003847, partial [Kiritimatiellia bacterium]
FNLAASIDMRQTWNGHLTTMGQRRDGCPDIFAGNPDVENIRLRTDGNGLAWKDFCEQNDGTSWGGFEYWEVDIAIDGDPTTVEGQTVEAERLLFGDGLITTETSVLYEFDGEATDGLTVVDAADGYNAWTYSSLVAGTATGSLAFDEATSDTPGGYRTDMYRRATGGSGDGDTVEARGNLFFFEHRIQERFDSIVLDVEFRGPAGAGPDDCLKEPRGWIGVRDENAFWYDLVFEPRYDGDPTDSDYPNDPYTACDGCGTLYVRGLEQESLEVCLDLSFLWDGVLSPPDIKEYAYTLHKPGEES